MLKVIKRLTERMSKSCRLGIFSHFRRKCFLTLGSAWKMARGMALVETQSVSVKLLLVILGSATIWHRDTILLRPEKHPDSDFKLGAYCSNTKSDMEKHPGNRVFHFNLRTLHTECCKCRTLTAEHCARPCTALYLSAKVQYSVWCK